MTITSEQFNLGRQATAREKEYLLAIHALEQWDGELVKMGRLARAMSIGNSALSIMLQKLYTLGWITLVPYQGASVTVAGKRAMLQSIEVSHKTRTGHTGDIGNDRIGWLVRRLRSIKLPHYADAAAKKQDARDALDGLNLGIVPMCKPDGNQAEGVQCDCYTVEHRDIPVEIIIKVDTGGWNNGEARNGHQGDHRPPLGIRDIVGCRPVITRKAGEFVVQEKVVAVRFMRQDSRFSDADHTWAEAKRKELQEYMNRDARLGAKRLDLHHGNVGVNPLDKRELVVYDW